MTPEETIRAYYDALRAGEPLAPFFAERSDLVKFGISERLEGFEAVSSGLREQTRTTADWTVESRRLRVGRRGSVAWFSDEVAMAWTDTEAGERRSFETRWSGTMERRRGGGDGRHDPAGADGDADGADGVERWCFVGMHVSAPRDL